MKKILFFKIKTSDTSFIYFEKEHSLETPHIGSHYISAGGPGGKVIDHLFKEKESKLTIMIESTHVYDNLKSLNNNMIKSGWARV